MKKILIAASLAALMSGGASASWGLDFTDALDGVGGDLGGDSSSHTDWSFLDGMIGEAVQHTASTTARPFFDDDGEFGDGDWGGHHNTPHTPRPSTGAIAPAGPAGTVPASGVCCSDGVPQVSSVTIAAATPSNNPGSGGGGFGGGDGEDKGDYNSDGSYAGVGAGDYNSDVGEGSFGGDADGHGGMF